MIEKEMNKVIIFRQLLKLVDAHKGFSMSFFLLFKVFFLIFENSFNKIPLITFRKRLFLFQLYIQSTVLFCFNWKERINK